MFALWGVILYKKVVHRKSLERKSFILGIISIVWLASIFISWALKLIKMSKILNYVLQVMWESLIAIKKLDS